MPRTRNRPPLDRHAVERRVLAVLRVVVIVAAVLASAGPLLYGIVLSLRSLPDVIAAPLALPAPGELDFGAYSEALRDESADGYGLARFMRNSLVVAVGTTVLAVACSTLGAYAAARLRFLGRDAVNGFFLAVYLFPGIVLAVPLFVLFSRMGLTRSLLGLVLIYLAQTVPVSLYMLRNYFRAVPASVEEAAEVDGCNRVQVITRVVLPMALPGITATALYVFMIAWNEFLFALLFLVDDRERWTVSLGIAQLTDFTVPAPVLMAGSIAITVPVVVGFLAAQRLLISGLTAGAEKG
ncbi:carbohydrate ABC transporter permease [Marinactinospora thermotolerans]|uniref:Carbohydrate ABC transporter membrane protein 2, CUT1 family (TC 3.A.1.1.-) n=1 Tax=Marinactinospora thermotolerans DSM 45154 TaxID=1122192 RepID=A0A1T4LUN4_9ACTN|nr:carbohydrate ABC transporter permease [Marinactinospora thermotolerans]SJZ58433.1 carbohydrate ABC transporter membrane protein 2, CUT1 family (TC 3.A.1.1.-) [Marinactinospora thermotolerans DSM 45154]